jgi:recombination protein RecT
MSNALEIIKAEIQSVELDFNALLTDKSIKFEREYGFAVQVLSGNDHALTTALGNKVSLLAAIKNIAAIGISLNPAKKQAYLVPRKGVICLDISYMGLMDLAIDTGSVLWAQCAVVYATDGFALAGLDKPPEHRFNPFSKDRGEIVGVYVVVKTRDGDYLTHPMPIGKVYDIRDRSDAWKAFCAKKIKSTPWATDAEEMIKKTCIKQAYKMWPKTERLEKAIHYLNNDGGEGIDFGAQNGRAEAAPKVDPKPFIDALLRIEKDGDALDYYKANVKAFDGDTPGYKLFRSATIAHRTKLQENEAKKKQDIEDVAFEDHPNNPEDEEVPA